MKVPIDVNSSIIKKVAKPNYNLWLANFGAFALFLQVGISYSWDSPNLAQLTESGSLIPLTETEASWLASTTFIGIFVGSLLGAGINQFIGSRKTILVTFTIMSIPWLLLIITSTVNWLYTARLLCGIAVGAATFSFPLYLGEISPPSVRGSLFAIAVAGIPTGTVIGTVAETYLPMKVSSSIYFSQCIVSIVLFLWLMDSPYYLVKRSDAESVKKSIVFYNRSCDVDKELLEINSYVKAHIGNGIKEKFDEFMTATVRKSTLLIIILFALPSLTGSSTIISYTEIIVKKSQTTWIDPKQYVIYVNLAGSILSIVTHNLIDKLGRRKLLLAAIISSAVAMSGLGSHFFLLVYGYDAATIQWLSFISIFISLTAQFIGLVPVATTMVGEIFSDNTKSAAACISVLSESLFTFIIVKLYQTMVDSFGEAYAFCFYAVLSLLAIPVALYMMPETKGKSLQEIQNHLTAKSTEKSKF